MNRRFSASSDLYPDTDDFPCRVECGKIGGGTRSTMVALRPVPSAAVRSGMGKRSLPMAPTERIVVAFTLQ